MKLLTLLTAGALTLGVTGATLAQTPDTVIRITGSTAFRAQTNTAILKVLGSTDGTTLPSTGPSAGKFGYNGTSRTGATLATFEGRFDGKLVIIQTSFTGSNGGIRDTAGSQSTVSYHTITDDLREDLLPAGRQFGSTEFPNPATSTQIPDVTMMDTEQAATPFLGSYQGTLYEALTETRVGVIGYRWIANVNAPVSGMSMTPLLAQALFVGGNLPLSLFTGNAADASTLVYATGRNADSGTRNAALTESGVGATRSVRQYDPNGGALYAGNGNGGESSGGTLVGKVRDAFNGSTVNNGTYNTTRVYVTYASTNDTDTPVQNGLVREIGWNGIPYSEQAVIEGRYSFWTYQNLGYRASYGGTGKLFADALAEQITLEDSPILLSEMKVTRPVDGGVITP